MNVMGKIWIAAVRTSINMAASKLLVNWIYLNLTLCDLSCSMFDVIAAPIWKVIINSPFNSIRSEDLYCVCLFLFPIHLTFFSLFISDTNDLNLYFIISLCTGTLTNGALNHIWFIARNTQNINYACCSAVQINQKNKGNYDFSALTESSCKEQTGEILSPHRNVYKSFILLVFLFHCRLSCHSELESKFEIYVFFQFTYNAWPFYGGP